jgi:hypothetical protein
MTINQRGSMKAPICAGLLLLLASAMAGSAGAGIVGPNESTTRAVTTTSSKDATGPPVDGLAISLSTTTPTIEQGSPVRISIEVRNVSSVTQYLLLPLSPCAYRISLSNTATGAKTDASPSGCSVYSAGPWVVEPGTSTFLAFRISDYAKFPVGTYTMRVEGLMRYSDPTASFEHTKIESNPVPLTVMP